jgi:hypothetical protein
MQDDEMLYGWASAVNKVICGERPAQPSLKLGTTPELLQKFGLSAGILTMSTAKIALSRTNHPDVPLQVWHDLPQLLSDPIAIFPSARRDGSIIIVLIVVDREHNPVLIIAIPSKTKGNVVLSVYGKQNGFEWAAKEMTYARSEGLKVYEGRDFAASLPQPPVANATSSSHGLIPSDGTTKSRRLILSIRK